MKFLLGLLLLALLSLSVSVAKAAQMEVVTPAELGSGFGLAALAALLGLAAAYGLDKAATHLRARAERMQYEDDYFPRS